MNVNRGVQYRGAIASYIYHNPEISHVVIIYRRVVV